MSKLKGRKPKEVKPKKPAILVMGDAGVGKTFTAMDFPYVYFIDAEGGATNRQYQDKLDTANGLYMGIEDGAQNFDDVLSEIRMLRSVPHDRKTLVIDSVTKLFNNEWANEQERLKKNGKKDEFGLSKKPAVAKSRELISLMSSLDMNVILISHTKPKWADGEQKGVTFDGYEKLEYELDLVLEVQKRGGNRVAVIRKSRLESFPEGQSIPWSYTEFAERWGKEILEKSSTIVELATAEQLTKFKTLSDLLKTTDEEKDKLLGWANVMKFEDMSSTQMAKMLELLNDKLPK